MPGTWWNLSLVVSGFGSKLQYRGWEESMYVREFQGF